MTAANFAYGGHFWDAERYGLVQYVGGRNILVELPYDPLARPRQEPKIVDPDTWSEECEAPWNWDERQAQYDAALDQIGRRQISEIINPQRQWFHRL